MICAFFVYINLINSLRLTMLGCFAIGIVCNSAAASHLIDKAVAETSNGNSWFQGTTASQNANYVHGERIKPSQIRFKPLRHEQLDRLGGINSIAQDNKGFIWFGGMSGLARYDGYEMKVFRHDPEVPSSLSGSYINKILISKNGDMWVATGEGLNKYEPLTETFVRVDQDLSEPDYDWLNATWDVIEAREGDLYIATDSGVSQYILSTQSFINFRPDDQPANGMSDRLSTCVLEDRFGRIWVGKRRGGLERFDPKTKQFKHFTHIADKPNSLSHSEVGALYEDSSGTLWVGTYGGLDKYVEEAEDFISYTHDPNEVSSLSSNIISSIIEDAQGNLIVSTDGAGLNLYSREADSFIRLGDSKGIFNQKVKSLYKDVTGSLWLGHFPTGISVLDRYASSFLNYKHDETNANSLSHSDIMAIAEDEQGNIWVGTDGGGLNFIDRNNSIITRYAHDPADPGSLSANPVLSILVDSDGVVWAGTWQGGLNRFNSAKNIFEKYKGISDTPKSIGGGEVWSIYQTMDGVIWFGTEKGLSRFSEDRESFVHYRYAPEKLNTIHEGPVTVIYEDRQGMMWVAGYMGLTQFDRDNNKFVTYRPDEGRADSITDRTIIGIFEDRKGNLWVSTAAGGVNIVDRENGVFKNYTAKDGLPDNGVAGILEDDDGYMWFSTGRGISRFDPVSQTFRNFTEENGLPGNLSKRPSALKTQNGELVFGTTSGLTIFNPSSVAENKYVPPLVLTDFQIFNKPVTIRSDLKQKEYPLISSISYVDTIYLNYKQSVFSLKFAALNYLMPEKNEYAYKLEGFEEDWNYVGNRRTATYTNLDSGVYLLKVRGSNNEGIWNESGASLNVVVLPPWWETWWAYTLYCLGVLALILRYVYSQHEKRQIVIEQNRLLEVKVAERTAELRRKNHDIQAMLSNIRQGLFTVDKAGEIHSEYSKYLESIFERKDLAGMQLKDLLFDGAELGSDQLNQVLIAAESMVGEEEMNYDFNRHLLVDEYDVKIGGSNKHLSLDWNPILDGELIDKLMVTVRDVTQLRIMESEAEGHRRELEIISQVLHVPSSKFMKFKNSAMSFIEKNRRYINSTDMQEDHIVALLFRNMHTIKGNCRTFGFSFLSDAAHDVESVYSQMKTSPLEVWDKTQLLSGLNVIVSVFSEYEKVYNTILGGNDMQTSSDAQYLLSAAKVVDELQSLISNAKDLGDGQLGVSVIENTIERSFSARLDAILEDLVESIPSLSEQLGKPSPLVCFGDLDLKIRNGAHELLNNVFAHLLRNCIDHGIEMPDERLQSDKPAKGKIEIIPRIVGQKFMIIVKDDGRGLNVDGLKRKGGDLGLWSVDDDVPLDTIAELVFISGVSTKDKVTDISGRGVGMDAVKQFLEDNGCNISIKTISANIENGYLPFEIQIELPQSMVVS